MNPTNQIYIKGYNYCSNLVGFVRLEYCNIWRELLLLLVRVYGVFESIDVTCKLRQRDEGKNLWGHADLCILLQHTNIW